MKFRLHRGGFSESMATECDIEPTMKALVAKLTELGEITSLDGLGQPKTERVTVRSYGTYPDPRNGWKETHMVIVDEFPVAFVDQLVKV